MDLSVNSIVDELAKRQAEREKGQEIVIERMDEYKEALNRIFSMSEGKLLAKYLIKYCGIFNVDSQLNPAKLVEENGKKSVYLKMIRPYLEKEIRMEIENG